MDPQKDLLLQRLKALRTRVMDEEAEGSSQVPQNHPLGMELRKEPTRDIVQTKIDRFLQRDIRIRGINSKFSEAIEITGNMKTVRNDFPDNELFSHPGYMLSRQRDRNLVVLGRSVIPMLATGFSPSGVAGLFLLAFHLRDPGNPSAFVLNAAAVPATVDDLRAADVSSTPLVIVQPHEDLNSIGDDASEASGYSFIAASALRLYTKSEDNYIKAFHHIQLGYERFYGKKMPITAPNPTREALKSLRHYFQHSSHAKVTLYRILYCSEQGRCDGIRSFLYELHLTNTGLHIIGIFTRLCIRLNCCTALLLTAMYTKEWENQITALMDVLRLIGNNDEQHKRKLWRFGRIFDDSFLTPLQTKSCPTLTYILAYALKSEAAESNADILNIVQLKDVPSDKKRLCEAAATAMVSAIRRSMLGDDDQDGKTFKKPRRPYEKERLDQELKLVGEYGLR